MRPSAIQKLLDRTGANWDLVERFVADGTLTEVDYRGERYFVRRWRTERSESAEAIDPLDEVSDHIVFVTGPG
jgi:hypothetical protein